MQNTAEDVTQRRNAERVNMQNLESVRKQQGLNLQAAGFGVPQNSGSDNYSRRAANTVLAKNENQRNANSEIKSQRFSSDMGSARVAADAKKNSNENSMDHAERLAEARAEDAGVAHMKNITKNVAAVAATGSPKAAMAVAKDALSIWKQINFIKDIPYVVALGAALLKDLMDFVAAETVILAIIFSVFCSIIIFMMLLLAGNPGGKKAAQKMMQKGLFIVGGGIVDSVPGLDFLPIETLTVALIYFMVLFERANAANEPKSQGQKEENQ